ncbi:MAG: hypothetical protein QGG40_02510, partial [Myxococcota bacterium]|nr:hypothetical protein [Myxococcota bacterium]
ELGDSVTLEVSLTGNGTLSGFRLPDAVLGAGFRTYDDSPELRAKVDGGTFSSVGVYRRAVVPEAEGELTVPGVRVWSFDPQQEQYVELRAEPSHLTVLPGEPGAGTVSSFSTLGPGRGQAVETLGEDILPVRGDTRVTDRTLRAALPLQLTLPAIPGIALCMLWLWGAWQSRKPDPWKVLSQGMAALPETSAERLAVVESLFRDAAALLLGCSAPELDARRVTELGEVATNLYRDLERARYAGQTVPELESRVQRFVQDHGGRPA